MYAYFLVNKSISQLLVTLHTVSHFDTGAGIVTSRNKKHLNPRQKLFIGTDLTAQELTFYKQYRPLGVFVERVLRPEPKKVVVSEPEKVAVTEQPKKAKVEKPVVEKVVEEVIVPASEELKVVEQVPVEEAMQPSVIVEPVVPEAVKEEISATVSDEEEAPKFKVDIAKLKKSNSPEILAKFRTLENLTKIAVSLGINIDGMETKLDFAKAIFEVIHDGEGETH